MCNKVFSLKLLWPTSAMRTLKFLPSWVGLVLEKHDLVNFLNTKKMLKGGFSGQLLYLSVSGTIVIV